MQKYLRFSTSIIHVINVIILSVFLSGCGGSGGVGDISPTTGIDSESTVRAPSDSRSADFGAHFLLPEQLENYSWVSTGSTKQLVAARSQVQNTAVAFDGVLIGVESCSYNPIPYANAVSNNWLIKDDTGQPVPYRNGDDRYVCDPAANGYAEAWADGAIARARESGCDYIWIDGIANEKLRWIVDRDRIPAKYRTANDNDWRVWQDAAYNWLTVVVQKAHAAGLKVALNIGDVGGDPNRRWTSGTMSRFARLVDAVMNEYAFVGHPGEGYGVSRSATDVATLISETQALSDKKVLLLAKMMNNDPDRDRKVGFAVASYMIARKPGDVFILWDELPREQWYPRWTSWHPVMQQAQNLGQASSAPIKDGQLWIRHYKNGTVVLNPTDQTHSIPKAARVNTSAPTTIPAKTGTFIVR